MPKFLEGLGFSLVSALLLTSSSQAGRNIEQELQRAIDMVIQEIYLPLSKISGLGLSIVQNDGKLLYTTGYGLADQEKGIPNGNRTQFLIGSITKSFTSTVLVKVLNEKFPEMGEAVLDTPIRKLLPQVNFTLIDRFRSEQATFRDLVAHRLCLFGDDLQLLAEPFEDPEEILYRQRYNREICSFRTEFQYNNQMYIIAGQLAGILAGKPFPDLVQDLLTEIGMKDSAFVKYTDDFSQMPNRAQPYYVMDNVTHPINSELVKRIVPSNAAGGLYATPNDMARYLRFRLNLGQVDGKQVVPVDCMRWMNKPFILMDHVDFETNNSDMICNYYGYGMGLMIGHCMGSQNGIQHEGFWSPYSSMVSLYPGKNLGIFTGTNMGPVLISAQILHETLFYLITGREVKPTIDNFRKSAGAYIQSEEEKESQMQKMLEKIVKEHSLKSMLNSSIIGKYGNGAGGDLEIYERYNEEANVTGLYLSYGKWYRGWVKHQAGDLYKLHFDTDVVQDDYAGGYRDGWVYFSVADNTLEFFQADEDGKWVLGRFKLGVSLDTLPPVPWKPDSCGPGSE